jgi:hypothetical protein
MCHELSDHLDPQGTVSTPLALAHTESPHRRQINDLKRGSVFRADIMSAQSGWFRWINASESMGRDSIPLRL